MRELPGSKIDVVVVGCGPAGTASALWCAHHGLRVVLLEREVFPRHRPGETLPPGVEPIFAQLGVAEAIAAAGFTRHPGTWVTWSGPRRFDPFGRDSRGSWYGFQAPREQLDPSGRNPARRPTAPRRSGGRNEGSGETIESRAARSARRSFLALGGDFPCALGSDR